MKVWVTKKQLLKELKLRQKQGMLQPGSWLYIDNIDTTTVADIQKQKYCSACAVGAFMCSLVAPETNAGDLKSHIVKTVLAFSGLEWCLEEKDYLSALSTAYESGGYHATIELIQDEFPDKFQVDIDGFKRRAAPKVKPTKKKAVRSAKLRT